MNRVQFIRSPGGEEMAVLPRADYERLVEEAEMQEDIRLFDEAMRELADGEDELIPAEFANRILDGESPVRVWREFRGLSCDELAARAGVDRSVLADLESRANLDEDETIRALAVALRVDPDDLAFRLGE
jgi:hypothetical protein